MSLEHAVERWRCPDCGLFGQTQASNVEGTNVAAHARVVGCDLEAKPAPEWSAGGQPAPTARS